MHDKTYSLNDMPADAMKRKREKELKKKGHNKHFLRSTKTKKYRQRVYPYLVIFFWIRNAIVVNSKNNLTLRMVWRINHSSYPISPRSPQKDSVCTGMSHNITPCSFKGNSTKHRIGG